MTFTLFRYLLEATLVWTVLLVFHRLILRNAAGWQVQRRFLLAAVALGLLLPLLPSLPVGSAAASIPLPTDLLG